MSLGCVSCGASGCRLWREYQTFTVRLLCAHCTAEATGKPVVVDTTDVGWWVPAVSPDEGRTFWGLTSIPDDDWERWLALPLEAASWDQEPAR